jgi:hypothetical protein
MNNKKNRFIVAFISPIVPKPIMAVREIKKT